MTMPDPATHPEMAAQLSPPPLNLPDLGTGSYFAPDFESASGLTAVAFNRINHDCEAAAAAASLYDSACDLLELRTAEHAEAAAALFSATESCERAERAAKLLSNTVRADLDRYGLVVTAGGITSAARHARDEARQAAAVEAAIRCTRR